MKKSLLLSLGLGASLGVLLAVGAAAKKSDAEIGKTAPAFTLTDNTGQKHSLSDYKGKYVVLEWINHGCPFVKKHYDSGNMQSLQKEAAAKGAVWLSIASSAEGKEGYMTPQEWSRAVAEKQSTATAVLLDPLGTAGKAYGAKTTPHMYIIDPQGKLIYKGAIDDKPSTDAGDIPGAKNYVRAALDEATSGKPVTQSATQAYGCSVKYK